VQDHVPTPRDNDKRYCFGAVNWHTGESYFGLSRKKDLKAFVLFLRRLMNQTSKKIFLVCDSYSVHKTQAVRDYVKEHVDRLQLVFLSTYSPWLDPIELFWLHLKKRVLANKFFETTAAQMRELWRRLTCLASDGPQARRPMEADAN